MKNFQKIARYFLAFVWVTASTAQAYELSLKGKITERTNSSQAKFLNIGEEIEVVVNLPESAISEMKGLQDIGELDYEARTVVKMLGQSVSLTKSSVYYGPKYPWGSGGELGYEIWVSASDPMSALKLGNDNLSSVKVTILAKMSALENTEGSVLERVTAVADLLGQDSIYRNSRIQLDWQTKYGFFTAQASIDQVLLRSSQGKGLVSTSPDSAPIHHRIPNQPDGWLENPSQWNAYIFAEDSEGIDCGTITFSDYKQIPISQAPNLAQEVFRNGATWLFYYHKKVEDAVILKWSHPVKGYFCSVVDLGH